MSHKVQWNRVEDVAPPVNTFKPLWWWDGVTVGMGHYYDQDPGFEDVWGSDGWQTGLVHFKITHWAEMVKPEPPICKGRASRINGLLWNYVPGVFHWLLKRLTGWRIVQVSGDQVQTWYYWSKYPE